MICSQILLCIAWGVYAIDYDVYEVDSIEQVTELHDTLSSAVHRAEVEMACACLWCAFPLMLMAIYGVRKMAFAMMEGTAGELLVYLADKSWLILTAVICVIVPALSHCIFSISTNLIPNPKFPQSDAGDGELRVVVPRIHSGRGLYSNGLLGAVGHSHPHL